MSAAIVAIPFLILILLICIALPLSLGVFVYRDAKSRGMEPLLWTLIAVLVPNFIGLIIYLVLRKDHIILNCPNCGGEVQEHFTTCPSCGQKLKAGCTNCGTALRPEWKICPQCGREITETESFTPPVLNKGKGNKGLVGIIIAIIAVPLLIIFLVILGFLTNPVDDTVDNYDHDIVNVMESFNTAVEPTEMEIITMQDADSALSDSDKDWIAECKEGEDGIYSKTIYKFESGGFSSDGVLNDDNGDGSYELIYAYTIIVVNFPDGKACNFPTKGTKDSKLGYVSYVLDGDGSKIPEDIEFTLEEVEDYDEYNNVFIVKSLYSYDLSLDAEMLYVSDVMESETIKVTIFDKSSSIDYTIPIQGESDYIEFVK